MFSVFFSIILVFSCFSTNFTSTQPSTLLLGTVCCTGQSSCTYKEQCDAPHQYKATIFNTIDSGQTEQSMKQSLQKIMPHAQISVTRDTSTLHIHIQFDPQLIALKLEQRETIEGKKRITLCVYDKQCIIRLEQMTKKPILQYAINQNILSAIA